jgi:hypothetical protein
MSNAPSFSSSKTVQERLSPNTRKGDNLDKNTGASLTSETTVANSSAEGWQGAGFGRLKEEGDEHSLKRGSPASTKH